MSTENKLEIDDFTKALAECINQAQCAVVDPMAHAEIWKDELIKLAKSEEPVSEDLEHAVNAYIGYAPEVDESSSTYGKRQAFKAGANWQKQQMMKDADDYIVDDDNTIKRFYDTGGVVGKPIIFGSTPDSINVGDHVKVIVIKED
jgi:hypothetical protein